MTGRILAWLSVLLLLVSSAFGEVTEVRSQVGESFVSYPQLQGETGEEAEKKINEEILASSGVSRHLVTLVTLGEGDPGLQVSYQVTWQGEGILSLVMDARGKMPNRREGQSWTPFTWWVETGERVTLSDLFEDSQGALAAMEELISQSVSLSEYVENGEVLPLPETAFTLDETGITFYYDGEQLQYLSGVSGSCHFFWSELSSWLKEEWIPVWLPEMTMTLEEQAEIIARWAEAGKLPGFQVALGDSMEEVVNLYTLTREPDVFPGGRYFEMEAALCRDVRLISDSMESGWEHSVLEGIQLRRGGLPGLIIGTSTRAQVLLLLGEPAESICYSSGMAFDYDLPEGISDQYRFGDYVLRLHTDEEGILRAIQLGR